MVVAVVELVVGPGVAPTPVIILVPVSVVVMVAVVMVMLVVIGVVGVAVVTHAPVLLRAHGVFLSPAVPVPVVLPVAVMRTS